jgi:hypothetical protein
MNKLIVIYGNPVDGFHYIGPFDEPETAIEWAQEGVTAESDWWVADLNDPNELVRIGLNEEKLQ